MDASAARHCGTTWRLGRPPWMAQAGTRSHLETSQQRHDPVGAIPDTCSIGRRLGVGKPTAPSRSMGHHQRVQLGGSSRSSSCLTRTGERASSGRRISDMTRSSSSPSASRPPGDARGRRGPCKNRRLNPTGRRSPSGPRPRGRCLGLAPSRTPTEP